MEIDKYLNKNIVENNKNAFFKTFKRAHISQFKFQNTDIIRGEKLLGYLKTQDFNIEQSFASIELAKLMLTVESLFVK